MGDMLEHRFSVDGYLAFLSEFDEETLFDELDRRTCGTGWSRRCAIASPALSADDMTMRFPILFAEGRRSRR